MVYSKTAAMPPGYIGSGNEDDGTSKLEAFLFSFLHHWLSAPLVMLDAVKKAVQLSVAQSVIANI